MILLFKRSVAMFGQATSLARRDARRCIGPKRAELLAERHTPARRGGSR
jgi:hypothetical protein